MTNKFSQYVTKHEVIAPKRTSRLASFCHFDAEGRIAEYVVHFVKELKDAGCDVYFVSNNESIEEAELAKIRPFVSQIILRKNIGYDFAAYFTGYAYAKDEGYKQVVFANDSVYGPFYPLVRVFDRMHGHDMWGITDATAGRYHIQSYFWVFNNLAFLNYELESFEFIQEKSQVVGRYEEGITQKLINSSFEIGVLCPKLDYNGEDEVLDRLKENIKGKAGKKNNLMRRIKAFFRPSLRRRNAARLDAHANQTGIFSNWYELVKYQECPFIKVGMLKKPGMEVYHEGEYNAVIRAKYPAFDLNLIAKHLKRA